jgi:hypothetical protein
MRHPASTIDGAGWKVSTSFQISQDERNYIYKRVKIKKNYVLNMVSYYSLVIR